MKLDHRHCTANTDEGCDCGAAEANAYIAYLHERIELLELENADLHSRSLPRLGEQPC